MSLLVGLILTALNGPVGTESRGVAGFANFDIAPLKDLETIFLLLALPDFLTFRHNLCYLHPPRGQISTLVCVCRYATEIQKDKFSLNYTNNL